MCCCGLAAAVVATAASELAWLDKLAAADIVGAVATGRVGATEPVGLTVAAATAASELAGF